jgi:zinc transporter ZupT
MILVQALLVAGLVLIHIFAGYLRFLQGIPRSRWLSMAGGVSVAYVFIHIFPDLEQAQTKISQGWRLLPAIEHHAYLVALLGLVIFYGLERLVKSSQSRSSSPASDDNKTPERQVYFGSISFHLPSITP